MFRPPVSLGGLATLAVVLAACNPNTTRPPFGPLPEAIELELELPVAMAVQVVAEALRADSIPATLVRTRDGYLETPWFRSRDGAATTARPLGVEVVRVRGWATPGRAGHTDLQLEAVYRPLADPSRPPRDLDQLVPAEHPVALRLRGTVAKLVTQYGDPSQLPPVTRPAATPPDTVVRPDTLTDRASRGRPRR